MTPANLTMINIHELNGSDIRQMIYRYSVERAAVRMGGPRFNYLDEAIATLEGELKSRGLS